MNLKKELQIAKDIAEQTGVVIMDIYAREFTSEEKPDDKGPVTEADLAANDLITAELNRAFPDDAILSEETTDSPERLKSKRVWCIDPIDGTKEFIAKNGEFCIQIGLIINQRPVLGVVHMPAFNKMYWGGPGLGAFVTSDGINTPLTTNDHTDRNNITLIGPRMLRTEMYGKFLEYLKPKQELIHGSMGYKAMVLADGKGDLFYYYSDKTCEWDICAPEAVLVGAGGKVTDLDGNLLQYNKPDFHNTNGVVATNGVMQDLILEEIEKFRNQESE